MNDHIIERICDLIVAQLGVDRQSIMPDASFIDDLEIDSLDSVELIMALENAFDIAIPDDAAKRLTTVQAVVDHVEWKLRQLRRGDLA